MASAADRDVEAAAPGSQGGASDQVVQLPPAGGAAADAPTTGQVHDEGEALPTDTSAAGTSPPEKISEVPKTDSSVAQPASSSSPSSEKQYFDDANEPEPVVSVKVWIVAVVCF